MTQSLIRIQQMLNQREGEILSPLAAQSRNGRRRSAETYPDTGYRQSFSRDADRILHSRAYTRYIDKTQVFYLVKNDHITHRVLHVQLVSKIARTIGRFLRLNEDLIEAIALGHDIGHAPFGHEGETFLSELCQASGIGHFSHNVQGVQFLDRVERKGAGWNLCLQTLDGILCHDGEVHDGRITPGPEKTFQVLDAEVIRKKADPGVLLTPMTLEGCVMRFSDTVGYIGRDIEDAIRLGLIRRSDLPPKAASLLGDTNGKIVHNLVTDIIKSSHEQPYTAFSPEVSEALMELKRFNYERIYLNPSIKRHSSRIRSLFHMVFEQCLADLTTGNRKAVIFTHFLQDMSEKYVQAHRYEEIVRDFIAGMTDNYFLRQCPEHTRPDYFLFGG
jgi:dGTPase